MTENTNLENLPKPNEEAWELKKRMEMHHRCMKSRYPPLSIEPMPYERQRLSGSGMTAEERALRKQWIIDQRLKPDEPADVQEALETLTQPVNPIKRLYRVPLNIYQRMLTPVIGAKYAGLSRALISRSVLTFSFVWLTWYQMKYAANTWENVYGWTIYGEKDRALGFSLKDRESSDFYDRGFKGRKALRDGKTSWDTEMYDRI